MVCACSLMIDHNASERAGERHSWKAVSSTPRLMFISLLLLLSGLTSCYRM